MPYTDVCMVFVYNDISGMQHVNMVYEYNTGWYLNIYI